MATKMSNLTQCLTVMIFNAGLLFGQVDGNVVRDRHRVLALPNSDNTLEALSSNDMTFASLEERDSNGAVTRSMQLPMQKIGGWALGESGIVVVVAGLEILSATPLTTRGVICSVDIKESFALLVTRHYSFDPVQMVMDPEGGNMYVLDYTGRRVLAATVPSDFVPLEAAFGEVATSIAIPLLGDYTVIESIQLLVSAAVAGCTVSSTMDLSQWWTITAVGVTHHVANPSIACRNPLLISASVPSIPLEVYIGNGATSGSYSILDPENNTIAQGGGKNYTVFEQDGWVTSPKGEVVPGTYEIGGEWIDGVFEVNHRLFRPR